MRTGSATRRGGFTLLELITVITIMFMMIGISTVSYFGMMKGAGMRNSLSNVRAVLLMSRQYAITHQARVFVVFQQDAERGTVLPVAQAGVVEKVLGSMAAQMAYDLPWEPGELTGGQIFNIDARSSGTVRTNTVRTIQVDALRGGRTSWQKGDRVGVGIGDREVLPRGFVFWDGGSPAAPETIIFNPDGTAGKRNGSPYSITIRELYAKTPIERTIEVNGLTGRVSFDEE